MPKSRQTRASRQPTHLLQTPDSFVRTPMPGLGLPHATGLAVIHACPALGASFLMYTAELSPGGILPPTANQRFAYVLSGTANLSYEGFDHPLAPDTCGYVPAGMPSTLTATSPLVIVVIEKRYEPLPRLLPAPFTLAEGLAQAIPLGGDPGVVVRSLFPEGLAFDFAVNTMLYAPSAALSQVEIHYMEHGLLMLSGSGTYRLGDAIYQVHAGDFIWMAPFCPQWFQADPGEPAKYLIYKDFNRTPTL